MAGFDLEIGFDVPHDEFPVPELDHRGDVEIRQVVLQKQPRKPCDDASHLLEIVASEAERPGELFGDVVGERIEGRKVPAYDAVWMAVAQVVDLAGHVGGGHHRTLARPVVGEAEAVHGLACWPRLDQKAFGFASTVVDSEERACRSFGTGGIGRLFHRRRSQTGRDGLGLQDDRAADFRGGLRGLVGRLHESALDQRNPVLLEKLLRLKFVKAHRRTGRLAPLLCVAQALWQPPERKRAQGQAAQRT